MPKLAHKKSRAGCSRCKSRRVKCDEVKPICGACCKHDVSCSYNDISKIASREDSQDKVSLPPTPEHESRSPSSTGYHYRDEVDDLSRSVKQKDELYLMYRYTLDICTTLPSFYPTTKSLYFEVVPSLAFEHDCLLDSIISLTALQLWRRNRLDPKWRRLHAEYYMRACKGHREALNNLQCPGTDPDVMFLTTIFIYYQAFLLLGEEPEPPNTYELPVHMLRLSLASRTLVRCSWPISIPHGRLKPLFDVKPNFVQDDEIFNDRNREPFERIPLWRTYDKTEMIDQELYEKCLSYFGTLHIALNEHEDIRTFSRRVMAMPAKLPERFVDLVDLRAPRALAMLALMFSMIALVQDELELFRGIPERQILGLGRLLSDQWRQAIQQAIAKIHW